MEELNNKATEIPYGSNILVNCPICWFRWEPKKYRKWNIILEIILWIPFIIPWIIYTIRRHINTICMCPKCKQLYLLETDWDNKLIDNLVDIRKKQMARFWIIIFSFLILWLFDIFWNKWNKNYWMTNPVNNQTYSINHDNYTNDTSTRIESQNSEQEDLTRYEEQKTHDEELTKQLLEEQGKETIVEEKLIDIREQVRSIIQEAVDWINDANKSNNSFEWASCSWDCAKRIIDINFLIDPTWIFWVDSNMKDYLTIIYNKLKEVKDVPVTINLNYWWNLYHSYTISKDWIITK